MVRGDLGRGPVPEGIDHVVTVERPGGLEAAEKIGVRVLLVHAKHERAREFYLEYGFEESPTDPLQLLLLMKDVRRHQEDRRLTVGRRVRGHAQRTEPNLRRSPRASADARLPFGRLTVGLSR